MFFKNANNEHEIYRDSTLEAILNFGARPRERTLKFPKLHDNLLGWVGIRREGKYKP